MATVIDALVVTLGLDPSKFTAGQRAALASAKKLEEEAKKSATGFEEQSARLMKGFDSLKSKAIGFVGVLMGASGIESFVAKMVSGDAATSRFARGLALGTKELAVWQQAAKTVGGTPEGVVATFTNLNDQVQNFINTGGPEFIARINQISTESGKLVDPAKAVKDLAGFYKDLIVALGSMKDQARAGTFARALGLTPADIALGQQGAEKLDALVAKMTALGVATKGSGDAMERLQGEFEKTATAAEDTGRRMLTKNEGWMTHFLRATQAAIVLSRAGIVGMRGPDRSSSTAPGPTNAGGANVSVGGTAADTSVSAGAGGRDTRRIKAGAGSRTAAMDALSQMIAANFGYGQFTSFDDALHKDRDSLHNQGRALDFTIPGGKADAARVASAVRAKLKELGIGGNVKDEYNFPSPGATGGHIHVSLTPAGAQAIQQSRTINVNGPITINAPSGNPNELAAGFVSAVEGTARAGFAIQADGGAQ